MALVADRLFHVQGVLPIAVGSFLEVTVFGLRTNVFGPPKIEPQPDRALVRDLNTGVVYGRTWHFRNDQTEKVDDALPFEPRADLLVVERVRGRVRATRIVHGELPGFGSADWVTSLLVTEEPAPYR
jgi:hypothetical protein